MILDTKCWVVTVLSCDHKDLKKESPNGCMNCEIMNWLPAFETEEECNEAYLKQHENE